VKRPTVLLRMRLGRTFEQAICEPKQHRQREPKKYLAFGEKKTLLDWARDPRCVVGYQIILKRLRAGIPLELGMSVKRFAFLDPRTIPLTAFGETKSIRGWARDPRCLVAYSTFLRRLHLGEQLEDALRRPDNEVIRPIWNEDRFPVDKDVVIQVLPAGVN